MIACTLLEQVLLPVALIAWACAQHRATNDQPLSGEPMHLVIEGRFQARNDRL